MSLIAFDRVFSQVFALCVLACYLSLFVTLFRIVRLTLMNTELNIHNLKTWPPDVRSVCYFGGARCTIVLAVCALFLLAVRIRVLMFVAVGRISSYNKTRASCSFWCVFQKIFSFVCLSSEIIEDYLNFCPSKDNFHKSLSTIIVIFLSQLIVSVVSSDPLNFR